MIDFKRMDSLQKKVFYFSLAVNRSFHIYYMIHVGRTAVNALWVISKWILLVFSKKKLLGR